MASLSSELFNIAHQANSAVKWYTSFDDAKLKLELYTNTFKMVLERVKIMDPIERTQWDGKIEKCRKKLSLLEKFISFIDTASENVDPRVEEILQKIEKIHRNIRQCPDDQVNKAKRKIEKYENLINSWALRENLETQRQIATARVQISAIHFEILKREPTIISMLSSFKSFLSYLPRVGMPLAIQFLERGLMSTTIFEASKLITRFSINRELIAANEDAKKFLASRQNSSPRISFADYKEFYKDVALEAIPVSTLVIPHPAPSSEILQRLQIVAAQCDSKQLPHIGVLFSLGDVVVPLVISQDRLVLMLDMVESDSRLILFGSLEQAATQIKVLLSEEIKKFPSESVSVVPVCLKKSEAAVHEDESSSEVSDSGSSTVGTIFSGDSDSESERELGIIPELKKIIDALSQSSSKGFDMGCSAMTNSYYPFGPLQGRIYFHLYHIHDKETPAKVNRSDFDYGRTAFHRPEMATYEEKLRAAQRVLLEALLADLHKFIDFDDSDGILFCLGQLKALEMDPRDLPLGTTDIFMTLLDRLFDLFTPQLKNEVALFLSRVPSAPAEDRHRVLKEFETALKAAWKI